MKQSKRKQYIHNYDAQYNAYTKKLEKAKTSSTNKNLISEFERECFIKEKIALPTRLKYLDVLITIAENYISKDFDKLNRKDFEDIAWAIEERDDITISTKQKYRAILKKFGRWLAFRDKMFIPGGMKTYPETVDWINTTIKSKDKPRIKASEILTEEEVEKLIKVADNPRDRAFIAMLYELGARIGEIGMLNLSDISRDEYGYIIDLSGKTGHRTPRIIFSDPYLTNWVNQHSFNKEKDAPLWLARSRVSKTYENRRLDYRALYKVVERLARKAKIKKRVHPHLFRHSRVTHLLKNKNINESQAKVYFGWTPSSKMLAEYSHLGSDDVNDVMLEINGIKKKEEKESKLKPLICHKCKTLNEAGANFCTNCASILDIQTAIKLDEKMQRSGKVIDKIIDKKPELRNVMKEVVREMIQSGEI